MDRILRSSGLLAAAAATAILLTACGSSASESSGSSKSGGPTSVKSADPAEIDGYADSTSKDATALDQKLKATYTSTKQFPASGDGLVELSKGNELKTYSVEGGKIVRYCIQHVEKQPDPNDTDKVIDKPLAATTSSTGVEPNGGFSVYQPGVSKGDGC